MNLNNENETSWAQIDIAERNIVDSMPYMSFRISIYKSKVSATQTEGRYYYAPKHLLIHDSARYLQATRLNGFKHEMRFEIEMWDEQMQTMVVNYLRSRKSNTKDPTIQSCNVRVAPFEQVKLVASEPCNGFKVPTEWTLIGQSPQKVSFSLTCDSESIAKELIEDARQHPESFRHFKLLLRLNSQDARRQEIVIRIENILSGNMMATLRQRFRNQVLLTAENEEKLVKESTTRVLAETFSNLDTTQPQVETEISNKIASMIISSRETISDEKSEMWNSVLWNDDNYRPDKLTTYLNKAYSKMDNEKKRDFKNAFTNTNKVNFSAKLGSLKIGNADFDFSRTGSQTSLNFQKFCTEIKDHLELTGEIFIPKPLTNLARINLVQLRDTQSYREERVRVQYYTGILATAINVRDINENSDSSGNADTSMQQPITIERDEFRDRSITKSSHACRKIYTIY